MAAVVEGGHTLHVHAYDLRRRGWTVNAGLSWMMEGRPALAADRQRRLLVAARGPAKDYWVAAVDLAGPRVSEWTGLQGVFGSDPVLTNCGTGPALVAGLDLSGHLWTRTLSWEQSPRSESSWTARGGGGFQGQLRAVCSAGQPVLAARSANGRVWIWPAARAEWIESEVDIKGELQLTSDRKGVWIAGRTAADGIRVCRGTMAGEVPAVGCVTLPARVSEFALCPLDEGVRVAAVFPDGELRWWDWPATDWQRPLLQPIRAVSLDQEVVAGAMGEE
ncbi:MAG: hypothetical protein JNN08_01325 [Bryobacterales bacterium]|nr:hypothetical protein [Bryobacterales bacterium]